MNHADIIVFALIAIFILLKLRSVLGRKDGSEEGMSGKLDKWLNVQDDKNEDNKVVYLDNKSRKENTQETTESDDEPEIVDLELRKELAKIVELDKSFTAGNFIVGARTAFEMVLKAFSEGDKSTLKNLLSSDVYKIFEKEIDKIEKTNEREDTTLISIMSSDITKISVKRNITRITMDFVTEQISVLRDKDDKIIDGDPSLIEEIKDEWVFERNLKSSNPNWEIAST